MTTPSAWPRNIKFGEALLAFAVFFLSYAALRGHVCWWCTTGLSMEMIVFLLASPHWEEPIEAAFPPRTPY